MELCEIVFWVCAALIVYPYFLYPFLLGFLARLFPRRLRLTGSPPRSASFVIAAYNEEANIDRRLTELTDLLDKSKLDGEIIVVSNGSTDGTAILARAHTKRWVRVIEMPDKSGKAVALNRGVAVATGEIVVFADCRQTWAPDALEKLLANFADPCVGAVSGDLVVTESSGALSGVGLYWRFEKWLRRQESRLGTQVGVTGAISAVRRELFRPILPGTLLDDVYWPLQVALQGKRVIHDSQAVAFDRLPEKTGDEFRRKVRTLAGNFQLAVRLPRALVPGWSPVCWQFLSRKLLRLVVPWALIGLLVTSAVLPGPFYLSLLVGQLGCYTFGFVALLTHKGGRPGSAAASFLVLNAAAWVAFWVWVSGRADRSWRKVTYDPPGAAESG